MSGAADRTRAHGLGGFEETLKDFWVSRPRRPARGRKIAGVAAGIGERYGIDPVIVRVAFVVATVFGGMGLALYVLGWLFFPGEDDQVSPVEALIGRGRSTMSKGFTIVLVIAFFPLVSLGFGSGWGWFNGGGIVALALLVTALYLLHRSRGHENRPVAHAEETMTYPMSTPGAAAGTDPLGAPPLAWDLPDPEPAYAPPPVAPVHEPRRPRSKVGAATFGAALLVAGAGAACASMGIAWFSAQHVIGLVLAVLGVGLVAGAFARGGRSLIWLAVPLSIAGAVLTSVPVSNYSGGFGDIDATPTTAAQVQPVYSHTAGDMRLDLTQLPPTAPVTTEVRAGAGQTTIIVPQTADVQYICQVDAGNVNCLGEQTDGVGRPAVTGRDLGTDGAGGLQVNVNVSQGAGEIEVRRG
ncbi:PspC domain-containing protein [Amycolatopsis acidiphila]|uniref:PspC domain-containing protein n=1 Tax=Amycolatopsis acidiphila TaxID=715473 RepID=A0A557ZYG9_9PSEU|nr:PspC domain-containing protein [Amycolatopsis acidiphila]TVT17052.1 PspC domain-containing protein [Amycolatopsis acidiphila]UIJ60771.1 PspC domain-containing protein [Amycolatopsis acidiphila]GHG90941.1 PspC family transcriptional regulator [Amycolatopsis acidiphila]